MNYNDSEKLNMILPDIVKKAQTVINIYDNPTHLKNCVDCKELKNELNDRMITHIYNPEHIYMRCCNKIHAIKELLKKLENTVSVCYVEQIIIDIQYRLDFLNFYVGQ